MYSTVVGDHFHNPRRVGPLRGATHRGTAGTPGDGPYVVLWLRVENDRVAQAAYQTYGCPAAVAAASMAAQMAEGRSLEEAAGVTPEQIVSALEGLPEGKEHCPMLAVRALSAALATKTDVATKTETDDIKEA